MLTAKRSYRGVLFSTFYVLSAKRSYRGVFRTQSHIYDEAFCENSLPLLVANYLEKSSIVDIRLSFKHASLISRGLLYSYTGYTYDQTKSPLHEVVLVYFYVLHLVTERSSPELVS